ncbi:hypothetical protein ADU00_11615 [Salmonella enterica subsp. enterica]|nr:hypothetical protein [Salmonella enterica subsp. enterica serovar Hvittingfoss]
MLHRVDGISEVANTFCYIHFSVVSSISWFTLEYRCSTELSVFYDHEVDIHINPKIGVDWQLRGH